MCEVIVRIWRELAASFADLAHAAVSNMPQLMDYHCYIVGGALEYQLTFITEELDELA